MNQKMPFESAPVDAAETVTLKALDLPPSPYTPPVEDGNAVGYRVFWIGSMFSAWTRAGVNHAGLTFPHYSGMRNAGYCATDPLTDPLLMSLGGRVNLTEKNLRRLPIAESISYLRVNPKYPLEHKYYEIGRNLDIACARAFLKNQTIFSEDPEVEERYSACRFEWANSDLRSNVLARAAEPLRGFNPATDVRTAALCFAFEIPSPDWRVPLKYAFDPNGNADYPRPLVRPTPQEMALIKAGIEAANKQMRGNWPEGKDLDDAVFGGKKVDQMKPLEDWARLERCYLQ